MDINNHNITKIWQGKKIRFREDGYGSMTDMLKAHNEAGKGVKRMHDWLENKETKAYLEALSARTGIPVMALIDIKMGGDISKRGTWGHRKVCMRFAQWLNPDFAVWVDFTIEDLMTSHLYQQLKRLEEEREKIRLAGIDSEKLYHKSCRTFFSKTGKGCEFHIGKGTNLIYLALFGKKSRQLEQMYPLTYWGLKRDVFQQSPLEMINRLLNRFVLEMEEANYNFKSIEQCMKFALMHYETDKKLDVVKELLIPDWEEVLLAQVKKEYPSFNYEDLKKWVKDGNDVRKFPGLNGRVIKSSYHSSIVEQ